MAKQLAPLHPGEVLREEFIRPYRLSALRVARAIGVPRTRIERIITKETGITGDTAVRLGKFFRTTPEFWMNLQAHYELGRAKTKLKKVVSEIKAVQVAA